MLEILFGLVSKLGLLMMLAFLLSKTKLLRRLITKQSISRTETFILIITFGILGALGSYFSINFNGALVNTRIIGIAAGGILGGPIVGFGAGLIAGLHRFLLDINGLTTLACSISTVLEGTMAGFVYYLVHNKERKWIYGLGVGAGAELFRKIMLLILVKPLEDAIILVKYITIPMVISNSIGLALFIAMIESAFIEQEKASAHQAKLTLKIANKTLPILRKGMNFETAKQAAEIIYNEIDIGAVRITDKEKILAHVGFGSEYQTSGKKIMTELTKKVIESDKYEVAYYKQVIEGNHPYCLLQSVIIVPLKEGDKVIGTLMLYKEKKQVISNIDIELALGLAQLFSTQLELRKIEEQSRLLTKAELRSLQAQINPHFLFNVLNTISILCRIEPEKARMVTINLADYYRKNLRKSDDLIDLSKEIEHVQSYLAIEKIRFDKKLTINFEIDKTDCLVPPLIIQPIVENAIKHGILPKDTNGTITIRVKETKNEVEVNIIDDGIGISKEQLKQIFVESSVSPKIGLYNVNQRLKYLFGEGYGLKIFSEINKGTNVSLSFPRKHTERKDELYA